MNNLSAGTIIVGLRIYLKHIPIFLLPIVYDFSEDKFKKQLYFLSVLLLFQTPMAVYQRFVQYRHLFTGDYVTGTLRLSGTLSIVLVCAITVLYGYYLKRRISLKKFLLLAFILFIPTTINETKATFILLPVGVMIPTLIVKSKNGLPKLKSILIMTIVGIVFISVFTVAYDWLYGERTKGGVFGQFSRELEGRGYLYQGTSGKTVDEAKKVGRIDALILAYKNVRHDIGHFMFGYGIGNVLESYLSSLADREFDAFNLGADKVTAANLIWEIGFLGLLFHCIFFLLFFKDAFLVRKTDTVFGNFALGWCAVIVILFICLIYKNTLKQNVINLLFWYFSGIIASKAYKIRSKL